MYLVELFWLEQCFLGKKPAASDKVVLGLLAAVLEVVTVVDTLAVPIPLPRHKLDAALGGGGAPAPRCRSPQGRGIRR